MKKSCFSLNVFKYEKKERIHFFINIVIGIVIAIVVHYIEKTEYGGAAIDSFIDKLIRFESHFYQNKEYPNFLSKLIKGNVDEKTLQEISFIEIDRQTLESWNGIRYPVVPRDKLAHLIEKIVNYNPKILIIDILFDTEGCKGEEKLLSVLENSLRKEDTIFIIPAFIDPLTKKLLYPYFYKELKAKYPNKIFLSSPYFYLSEYDNTARFFKFYEIYQNEKGQKDLIWNVSFLAHILSLNKLSILDELKEKILSGEKNLTLTINRNTIHIINEDLVSSRLRFPYPVVLDNEENHLTMRSLPIYPSYMDEEKERIRNKIVILGVTDPIKHDYFKTPVGYMPGMYLIGNGTFTIVNLQIHHESLWIKILIEIFVILLAAYLFLWMDSIPATIFSFLLIGLLIPISVFLFYKYNLFINVILSILGIVIHKDIAEFEEFLIGGLWKKH